MTINLTIGQVREIAAYFRLEDDAYIQLGAAYAQKRVAQIFAPLLVGDRRRVLACGLVNDLQDGSCVIYLTKGHHWNAFSPLGAKVTMPNTIVVENETYKACDFGLGPVVEKGVS